MGSLLGWGEGGTQQESGYWGLQEPPLLVGKPWSVAWQPGPYWQNSVLCKGWVR